MKIKLFSYLIIFVLFIGIASAGTVTRNGITISSSKDTYFCEPVFSSDGCLIKTKIFVTNDKLTSISANYEIDLNRNVALREYNDGSKSIATKESRGRQLDTSRTDSIGISEVKTISFQFYVKKSGKFNFSVFIPALGQRIKLDPFFNISISNTTSPSLHLINGTTNLIDDNLYEQQIEISTELSDNDDLTTFQTNKQFSTDQDVIRWYSQED